MVVYIIRCHRDHDLRAHARRAFLGAKLNSINESFLNKKWAGQKTGETKTANSSGKRNFAGGGDLWGFLINFLKRQSRKRLDSGGHVIRVNFSLLYFPGYPVTGDIEIGLPD